MMYYQLFPAVQNMHPAVVPAVQNTYPACELTVGTKILLIKTLSHYVL